MSAFTLTEDIKLFILLVAVLLFPKFLMRFRIPSGLTAIALGVLTGAFLGWYENSQTLYIMATLGITSLFLFAGLEVDLYEFRRDATIIIKHLAKTVALVLLCAALLSHFLDLETRAAILLSLGLTTPSTGFILNSLNGFNFTEDQRYWIRAKAIAKEVVALIVLFFALQSSSVGELSLSLLALAVMIVVLPILFRFFLRVIAPFAPDSEVTFMILLAMLCGVITRALGTYYLIGAFIVGVTAAQFQHFISHEKSEKMFYSVGFFFAFFVPFYFFKAGLSMAQESITPMSLLWGLGFLVVFVPVRYFSILLSIRLFIHEYWKDRKEIAMSLMPTLIFGLVVASILRTRFAVDPDIVAGLVIYTLLSSAVPSLFLEKAPPEDYDTALIGDRSS